MMPAKQSVIQNGVSPGNEIQGKAGNILERVATRARTLQYKISMLGWACSLATRGHGYGWDLGIFVNTSHNPIQFMHFW